MFNSDTAGKFKLNRIQRKAYVRLLQSIVVNQRDSGSKESYSDDQRIQAAKQLIEFGTDDEVKDTFEKQLRSQDSGDNNVNMAIMALMAEGFRTGIAELSDD